MFRRGREKATHVCLRQVGGLLAVGQGHLEGVVEELRPQVDVEDMTLQQLLLLEAT